MNNATAHPPSPATPTDDTPGIVDAFLDARRNGRSLPDFPGVIPDDLEAAYAVQDQAIARWADPVVGWKVGYIAPVNSTTKCDNPD